jgi:hypothetical protein
MLCSLSFHSWNGCICSKCGKTRHEWQKCTCKLCGKVNHEWDGCICLRCHCNRNREIKLILSRLDECKSRLHGTAPCIRWGGHWMSVVLKLSHCKNKDYIVWWGAELCAAEFATYLNACLSHLDLRISNFEYKGSTCWFEIQYESKSTTWSQPS